MKIGLTVQQALDLVKDNGFSGNEQLFSIHTGLEHGPVYYRNGQLWVGDDILLEDLADNTELVLFVNSIENEIKDLYAIREYGLKYDVLSAEARAYIKQIFLKETQMDIDDPIAAEVLSVFGYKKPIPDLIELKDGAINEIVRAHYPGKNISRVLLAGEDYAFLFYEDDSEFRAGHHRLSDLNAMNSRIVDSLSRQIESLTKQMELHRSYEKELSKSKEKEIEMDM